MDYDVVFDGTANRSWGRHIFVEAYPQRPAPAEFAPLREARGPYRPVRDDALRARVLASLAERPQTAFELSVALKAHDDLIRNALSRLRFARDVEVVSSRPNPNAGEKGQRRWVFVYGVRQ
jgi:hypothetical protein